MEKREERERTQISRTGISSNPPIYLLSGEVTVQKGFTLIEIIVVIFIISIGLTVVLPAINIERSLKSEARLLSSILRYIMDTSITKKERLTVTVNLQDKTLQYETPEGKKKERFPHLQEVRSPSRGTIRDSELIIFFYPSGIKEQFIFVLKNEKETYEVEINPVSNRVITLFGGRIGKDN